MRSFFEKVQPTSPKKGLQIDSKPRLYQRTINFRPISLISEEALIPDNIASPENGVEDIVYFLI